MLQGASSVTKWTVQDHWGHEIYLTEERWRHILESRPDMEPFLEEFLETIRTGERKQDALLPYKFFYNKRFDVLLPENNHMIAVVLFKHLTAASGTVHSNNFVVSGWMKYIEPKR
jgi:hypothetical protein